MENGRKRNVVITGCSRGLGRAMVQGFIAGGWGVAGCGRSRGRVAEIEGCHGGDGRLFAAVDVTDEAGIARFAREAIDAFGAAPDLVLNNAALINRNAPLWDVSCEEFSQVVDVNLKGVHNVIRAFVPEMLSRGSGVVVNFSSGWGRSTSPDVAPYCCTKWGVEGLTAALAQELPAGMATVALNPGIINTDMLRSCFGDGASAYPTADEWALAAVPFLGRIGPHDNGKVMSAP